MNIRAHPLAVVHDDVEVGSLTQIWQFASVIRGARIGAHCIIGAGAQIDGARIGDGCHIQNGASIPHGVEIGNRVFVGPLAVFCNDAWPDCSKQGIDHGAVKAGATIRVGDGATIGAGAVILPGVIIGSDAVVAAGAVVTGSVPPGMMWRRNSYIGPLPEKRERMRLLPC